MCPSVQQSMIRREKILKMLHKANGNTIKGVDIAGMYGVCEGTIHKDIAYLRREGTAIHTRSRGGYVLSSHADKEDDIAMLKKEIGVRLGQEARVMPTNLAMFNRFKGTKEFPLVSSVFHHLCPINSQKALANINHLRQKFLS